MARQRITGASYESLFVRATADWPQVETVILAPSKGAAEDLLRSLPGPGVFGGHTFTLAGFAAQVATHGGLARAPLSQLSQQAVTARVVFSAAGENRLRYFDPVADRPGFIRAVSRTLRELRLQGTGWQPLRRSGRPGEDLAWLGQEYERQLTTESLADLATLFSFAAEVAESGGHPWDGLPLVLWDLPLRHALERRFVEALAARASSVREYALAPGGSGGSSSLARVRQYLFASELPPRAGLDDSVTCFSAPGEGLECVEIARRIQRLAAAGTPFDRMAVLLRAPERYQPLVEEAFRRAGIPACLSRGSARPDPAGRAFLALLLCALENCSATRFSEYLSLAQVPELTQQGEPVRTAAAWIPSGDEVLASFYGDEPTADPPQERTASLVTPAGWERLIVDAAVVGGRDRWERRLRGLSAELRFQRARMAEGEAELAALDRRLTRLTGLERFALPLIGLLDDFPKTAKWGVWLQRLTELAETALRRPESVTAVLRELQPMSSVGPVTLDEVYGVLEDRLRFLRQEPARSRYGQVFVSSIEEARGRRFDVVFLPGLAEGLFPRRAAEDPLLLDHYRTRLGGGLATRDDRVAEERLLLHIAAAVGERLVFSYPRVDVGQARPRVPSFYALEIIRAAEGWLPDLKEFEKRASSEGGVRLGWPAPRDTAFAIDDTEYDLAALAGIDLLPAAQRKGRARYLLETNPALGRALRTRFRRWKEQWTTVDGIVDADPETRRVLAGHRLKARPFSATSLQQFAACPYRFLLYAIHYLRPREEAAGIEQLDPLTRGALFHTVQHELFEELRRRAWLPLQGSRMNEVLDLADRVLDNIAAQYAEELAPAIPRVWRSEIEDIRSDLRGWLHDSGAGLLEWNALHSEFTFANTTVAGGFQLRGAVDLIEEQAGRLRVTDHKTGRPAAPNLAFTGGGKVLQPLLYALAVEALLDRPVVKGRLYYCTHRGNYKELEIPFNEAARKHIHDLLEAIDSHIERGFLPAAPESGACERCDYRVVCGPHEEIRIQRKPASRLRELAAIRSLS